MSDTIIQAEGLGKSYIIGRQKKEEYTTMRDVIANNVRSFGKNFSKLLSGNNSMAGETLEEFWALSNINFEIKQGEALGIIGRNGAGKSTLLKILSRITEPTKGRVTINGRLASLLEVGTGFHPELSGRENIYLNGAILGMSRHEIRNKFDEIVDFSGVEKFLDTPVKRFSSGMYVRLAFAVAAHLESEILIIDEVLAVGDAEFQRKCLRKMGDVTKGEGRTVLFVSHDMNAILSLCPRSMLLDNGSVKLTGNTNDIIDEYRAINGTKFYISEKSLKSRLNRCQSNGTVAGDVIIKNIEVVAESNEENLDSIVLRIQLVSNVDLQNGDLGIHIGFQKSPNSPVDGGRDFYFDFTIGAGKVFTTELKISNLASCVGDYLFPYIVLLNKDRQPYDVIDVQVVEVPALKIFKSKQEKVIVEQKSLLLGN